MQPLRLIRLAALIAGVLLLGACASNNDPPLETPEGEAASVADPTPAADEVEITKAPTSSTEVAQEPPQSEKKAAAAAPRPNVEPPDFAGVLEAHNHWRKQVGTPALAWSNAAADVAQTWADELARRGCQISHSPGDERRLTWGENVFSYWRGGAYESYRKTPEMVVDRWASEGRWYDNKTQTCKAPRGSVCGHFTQVISTYSTHVGCGRARCETAEVWVCNYSPPGNYKGVSPY
jgi:pathogenesis-related protein 1